MNTNHLTRLEEVEDPGKALCILMAYRHPLVFKSSRHTDPLQTPSFTDIEQLAMKLCSTDKHAMEIAIGFMLGSPFYKEFFNSVIYNSDQYIPSVIEAIHIHIRSVELSNYGPVDKTCTL